MSGEELLTGAGSVSHKQAEDKAVSEYRKYQAKTLSEVETAFLDSIETLKKSKNTEQYQTDAVERNIRKPQKIK